MTDTSSQVVLSRHAKESGELVPRQIPSLEECYPSSHKMIRKVEHDNFQLELPFRRIQISDGTYYDAYDTTGPQGINVLEGLAKVRKEWVEERLARGDQNFSQNYLVK